MATPTPPVIPAELEERHRQAFAEYNAVIDAGVDAHEAADVAAWWTRVAAAHQGIADVYVEIHRAVPTLPRSLANALYDAQHRHRTDAATAEANAERFGGGA